MKVKKWIALTAAAAMLASVSAVPVWAEEKEMSPDETVRLAAVTASSLTQDTDGAYIIASESDYQQFCDDIAGGYDYAEETVKLTDSIVVNQMAGSTTRRANIVLGQQFAGVFDGANNTITLELAVTESKNEQPGVGLFSGLDGATVKNLNLTADINVTAEEYSVGGIAGYMTNGAQVIGCTVDGTIMSVNDAGGIVGKGICAAVIRDCINNADVSATKGKTGGIASSMYYVASSDGALMIENCANNGAITASEGGYTGGIVGLAATAVVSGCTNNGAVTGNSTSVGGVVGEANYNAQILDCTNTAEVENTGYAGNSLVYGTGGIVGWVRYTESPSYTSAVKTPTVISGCVNEGNVTAENGQAGGVLGTVYDAITMLNCENRGYITGKSMSGGVIGNYQDGPATFDEIKEISNRVTVKECTNYSKAMSFAEGTNGAFIGHMPNYEENKFLFENNGTVAVTNDATGEVLPTGGYYDKVTPEGIEQVVTTGDSLQNILDNAIEGSVVTLDAGLYDGVFYINKPLTLKSKNGAQVGLIYVQADDVTLDGLTFVTVENNQGLYYSVQVTGKDGTLDNLLIQNCVFEAPAANTNAPKAISIADIDHTNIVIQNNRFSDAYETAAYIRGGNGITLRDNDVQTAGFGFRFLGTTDAVVTGNYFNQKGYGFLLLDHAAMEFRENGGIPNTNITVTENVIDGRSNIVFESATPFGDEKLDLSRNYWGGGLPSTSQVSSAIRDQVIIDSYYAAYDPEAEPPLTDMVVIPADGEEIDARISFEQIADEDGNLTNQIAVYANGYEKGGTNGAVIQNFVAAEIGLDISSATGASFAVQSFESDTFTIESFGNGTYLIHERPAEDGRSDISGQQILLGTITLGGYGTGTIGLKTANADGQPVENWIQTRTNGNIVQSILTDGATSTDFEIKEKTAQLTVDIRFNNPIDSDNEALYNSFSVTVEGANGMKKTYWIGESDASETGDTVYVPYTSEGAAFTVELPYGYTYTVTASGKGYRTFRKSVSMNEDTKTLYIWNNAYTNAETVIDDQTAETTFLAGDILMDNTINLYDLSAVVSYFGKADLKADVNYEDYLAYDLNRDGKIDSRDVAMVLVSWGK